MTLNEKISKFLDSKSKELQELGEFYPEKKSLIIDYGELEESESGMELVEELIDNPDEIISIFENSIQDRDIPTIVKEPKFHVRFTNLPRENMAMVRNITSEYISKFVSVEGVVNKTSDVLPKVSIGIFICNKCGEIHEEPQPTRFLREPIKCSNCERRDFRFVPERSEFMDIQRLEIQEPLEILVGGEQARRIELWVEDDLTDRVTPGDKIIVNGVVRLMPPVKKGPVYRQYIDANFIEPIEREFAEIEITPEEKKEIIKLSKDPHIYENIINSIAPSIYGYKEVKESVALQLFGGRYGKSLPDGTSVRSDMHLLLVGDPGIAKSRLLQYVDQLAPKSIYVSGKGTTGAGLTAIAEKDEFADGAWTLKAGALVLAGGGIAAIDEFDKMGKTDRESMHEAMEQQTISVAKAGIVAKFKADTAVLAASNPKFSRFDSYSPIGEQFDIPPTLLSRFDLIFPIRDILDAEQDKKIADHILKMHKSEEEKEGLKPPIPVELFRKYIAHARKNISPVLTDDAAEKIKDYYVTLRSSGSGAVPASPRQLEALIRLSEASAKIRLSNTVTVSDVERAIDLTNFVLREVAMDEEGRIDMDRIVTDHPKTQRDRIRTIENIIQRLVAENDGDMALFDDIIRGAEEQNIDKDRAKQILQELKNKGIIYEPSYGKYKWLEG